MKRMSRTKRPRPVRGGRSEVVVDLCRSLSLSLTVDPADRHHLQRGQCEDDEATTVVVDQLDDILSAGGDVDDADAEADEAAHQSHQRLVKGWKVVAHHCDHARQQAGRAAHACRRNDIALTN